MVRTRTVVGLLRRCHRLCRWAIPFEDFCQNVLLNAVRHQASFRGQTEAEMAGWIKAIGNRCMIDALRRSRQEKLAPLPQDIASPEDNEDPVHFERLGWVMQVLKALPVEDQEILLRRYWQKQSWNDVAAAMNLSANTLSQKHLRLLVRLRALGESHFFLENVS